jgi:hypothetical protein
VQFEGLFSAIRALIRTALEAAPAWEQRAACRVVRRRAPGDEDEDEDEDEGGERKPSRSRPRASG